MVDVEEPLEALVLELPLVTAEPAPLDSALDDVSNDVVLPVELDAFAEVDVPVELEFTDVVPLVELDVELDAEFDAVADPVDAEAADVDDPVPVVLTELASLVCPGPTGFGVSSPLQAVRNTVPDTHQTNRRDTETRLFTEALQTPDVGRRFARQ